MKKSLVLFLLLVVVFMCFSCKKATYIVPDRVKVSFTKSGGELTIKIRSDGSWDIKDCPDWLKTEVSDSTLVLYVEENKTGAARNVNLRLMGDNNVESDISITQADRCTYIIANPKEVTIPKEGGTKDIYIDTDGENIITDTSQGIGATIADGIVTVTAPSNPGSIQTEKLTLACDTVTTIVNVVIKGSICGRCGGRGTLTCSRCRGKGWYSQGDGALGCSSCGGGGSVEHLVWTAPYPNLGGWLGSGRVKCPDCGGTGK